MSIFCAFFQWRDKIGINNRNKSPPKRALHSKTPFLFHTEMTQQGDKMTPQWWWRESFLFHYKDITLWQCKSLKCFETNLLGEYTVTNDLWHNTWIRENISQLKDILLTVLINTKLLVYSQLSIPRSDRRETSFW